MGPSVQFQDNSSKALKEAEDLLRIEPRTAAEGTGA